MFECPRARHRAVISICNWPLGWHQLRLNRLAKTSKLIELRLLKGINVGDLMWWDRFQEELQGIELTQNKPWGFSSIQTVTWGASTRNISTRLLLYPIKCFDLRFPSNCESRLVEKNFVSSWENTAASSARVRPLSLGSRQKGSRIKCAHGN